MERDDENGDAELTANQQPGRVHPQPIRSRVMSILR